MTVHYLEYCILSRNLKTSILNYCFCVFYSLNFKNNRYRLMNGVVIIIVVAVLAELHAVEPISHGAQHPVPEEH